MGQGHHQRSHQERQEEQADLQPDLPREASAARKDQRHPAPPQEAPHHQRHTQREAACHDTYRQGAWCTGYRLHHRAPWVVKYTGVWAAARRMVRRPTAPRCQRQAPPRQSPQGPLSRHGCSRPSDAGEVKAPAAIGPTSAHKELGVQIAVAGQLPLLPLVPVDFVSIDIPPQRRPSRSAPCRPGTPR